MKHLKKYKIFESEKDDFSGYSLDEVTTYIKDMLLDFEDDGFNTIIKSQSVDRFDNSISISIDHPFPYSLKGSVDWEKYQRPPLEADRILTFTDRIKSYFDMEGIKYDIQYQWHDDKGVFKLTSLDELELPSGLIGNMWIEIFIDKQLKST